MLTCSGSIRSRSRCRAAANSIAALAVFTLSCGTPPPSDSCPEETQLTIGSEFIGSEPTEIDFGVVPAGLSATVRISYVVACNLFVDGASAGGAGDGDVFSVGDASTNIQQGQEGFATVSAHPVVDREARGELRLLEDGDGLTFPLVVNEGRE